jgi:AraC-like DNA-binding protein
MMRRGANLTAGCTSGPTVAAGVARGLLGFAVSQGAAPAALLERSGIEPAALEDHDNRIPLAQYVALMRAAKELAADPALALHFGEAIDLSEMSLVGLIGAASETLADALAQTNRYARLVVEVDLGGADRFRTARDAEGLWLIDARRNPNDFPELTESSFARMAGGSRRFGHAPLFKAVHVTHADPGYRAEYDRIFRAPVTFESDRNAVLIDAAWMTRRIALQPRYVFGVLSERAEALLEELERSRTTRGRVESLLLPILHTGEIGMDIVATKLGVSRWTLARRLKGEGATFEQVLDALRRRMALHYLSESKVTVNETAYLVGFSDPAAFSRAFKRWTGATPRDVRRARAAE